MAGIAQVVAAVASFLAAVAALSVAYLNWRARPLAVTAIQLHSKKLQEETLPSWKSRLPTVPYFEGYATTPYPFSNPDLSHLESSDLFQDLKNHPPGDKLIELWKRYREEWETLEAVRTGFALKVRGHIESEVSQVGLRVGTDQDRNVILEQPFVTSYYNNLHELVRGRDSPYRSMVQNASTPRIEPGQPGQYMFWFGGNCWAIVDETIDRTQVIALLQRLVQELPNINLVQELHGHIEAVAKLEELRQQIIQGIDSLIALPLLPNAHCPLLKAAEDPLTPAWLRRLLTWVKGL